MPDIFVSDFRLGLDVRRSILTAEPGSLYQLDNAVITPGGEVQKCKSFVLVATLPAGQTQGLHGTNTGAMGTEQVFVFAPGVAGAAPVQLGSAGTIPILQSNVALPSGDTALQRVISVEEYGPQNFFVAGLTGPNGTLRNWWEGNSVPNYVGFAPLVSGQKMYRVYGPNLYFSGVGDPSVTDPLDPGGTGPNTVNPGAGFIDTSRIDSDSNWLIGMEAYYQEVAVFSRRACLLFTLDPDLANNTFRQVLRIGAVSNGSILQFGTGDVLFLSDSGVRSLRVLNYSLAAGVTDVGSPIDVLIQAAIAANPNAIYAEAVVEVLTGRYWLAIGNTIYILSYWPSAKISAWSTITLPFNVDHITTAGNRVFIRSGDNVYLYGGANNATYDTNPCTIRTPFMAGGEPMLWKKTKSISAMVQGNWAMNVGMRTDLPTLYELAANLTGDTYSQQVFPFAGFGTHVSFQLTCADAAPSILGALAVKFQESTDQ